LPVIDSPFPYHGPLEPAQVHGRDDLVEDLVERVTARRPTVLIAPRRYGKTSVLGVVASRLSDTTTVVEVDLYELRSWADFADRLDRALAEVRGPSRSALDRLAATVEINLGVVKSTLGRRDAPAADIVAGALADVLVKHAATTPTLVIFDEFSSIVGVEGAAGMLRTRLQRTYQQIGLLFAGSEPSTMRMLFADPGQPFYAQADLLDVPPLGLTAFTELVDAGFDGAPPAGLAGSIHQVTSGHPQRSMQLADAAWSAARAGLDPEQVWPAALDSVRKATSPEHEARFAEFRDAEQAVLRLAADRVPMYGADARRLSLAPTSASRSLKRLIDLGVLAAEDTTIIDPLFDDWVRRRFNA
jgi:uncharacterized protein